MAKNRLTRDSRHRGAPEMRTYNRKTLRRDREYGFFWYDWLWRVLRPLLILLCALIIVVGTVVTGWKYVYGQFFMPVEPGNTQTIDFVIDKGMTITQIGDKLYAAGLLRNKGIFKYIIQFQGLTSKIQFGSYPLSLNMDVNQIISTLTAGSASNERTLTIIPGWTVEDIADYLVSSGALPDKTEFLTLCNDIDRFKDSSYALQNAAASDTMSGRKYALEGYLAPDTYRVYTNATAESIILTLLKQNEVVIDSVFNAQPATQVLVDENGNVISEDTPQDDQGGQASTDEETPDGETPDGENPDGAQQELSQEQVIVLASIIEREAGRRADYAKVSAVFHNRLDQGMKLESDATASYPLGIRRLVLTADELMTQNGYNTYTRDGLPIGPICNPSKAAIAAALTPDPDYVYEGYIYFCSTDPQSGALAFAKTREEHLNNIAAYRGLWIEHDRQSELAAKAAAEQEAQAAAARARAVVTPAPTVAPTLAPASETKQDGGLRIEFNLFPKATATPDA